MRNYIDTLWAMGLSAPSRPAMLDTDATVLVIVGTATILSAILAVI